MCIQHAPQTRLLRYFPFFLYEGKEIKTKKQIVRRAAQTTSTNCVREPLGWVEFEDRQ
jgi:hypothetical protein